MFVHHKQGECGPSGPSSRIHEMLEMENGLLSTVFYILDPHGSSVLALLLTK